MLYITLFVMVYSFGNCRDTLPEVGAGREIQDGVQDGCRIKKSRVVTWKLAVDFCESCDSQNNL